MLGNKIIGAIRKLFGFQNVADAKAQESRLVEEAGQAHAAGDVNSFVKAILGITGLRAAAREETPVRPTVDDIEIVKSVADGYPDEPDGETLTLYIKSTGDFVDLYLKRVGHADWKYDFSTARLAHEDGKAIPGEAGNVPENVLQILESRYGHAKLAAAPAKRFG
jgi:hypothetical protein